MIRVLKQGLKQALSRSGRLAVRMTPRAQVFELIDALRPVDSGHPLIRFGPPGDGGYLIPDDLAGIAACFSPGVKYISGFERDCAQAGMRVFMADYSVDSPVEMLPAFSFEKKFIGASNHREFMTLDRWVAESGLEPASELMLQMDIEGYEYEVLFSLTDELLSRMRIVVVELHRLERLWDGGCFGMLSRSLYKLLHTHTCVHIHPNNCCGEARQYGVGIPRYAEFTFLRNDRIQSCVHCVRLPHLLDVENTDGPPLVLDKIWYRPPR